MTDPGDAAPNGAKRRPRLLGEDALSDDVERLFAAAAPRAVVPGWATVELDRAEEELAAMGMADHADGPDNRAPSPPDLHLGARSRILRSAADAHSSAAPTAVLLEASTEGPLAAALARHGEGFVTLYLLADPAATERVRRAGFTVAGLREGPLGPQRLVRTSPVWGPFLMLVTED